MEQKNDFSLTNIQLKDELGAGTFGKVYSGYLKSNGMKIAFKRISKKKISSYGQYSQYLLDALKKEFECMKMCNCENSVRVYNFLETGNNYNFVMELCDNDLSNELKKRPNGFDVDEVRNIMSQLNNAFKKMVEHNIIHRDLKLGNILITYTDETKTKFKPKLCDYGFSKVLNDSFTQTHLGTPATMAPEIMSTRQYQNIEDARTTGVDLSIRYGFRDWAFGLGYSWLDTNANQYDGDHDRMHQVIIDGTAHHKGNFFTSWNHRFSPNYRLSAGLYGRMSSKRYYQIDGDGKGYQIWRVATTHDLGHSKRTVWRVEAGVDNIFNYVDRTPHGLHLGTTTPGTTFYLGLTIRFNQGRKVSSQFNETINNNFNSKQYEEN